jgi:hypothetical protein
MTKLNKMWEELVVYQPQAEIAGYGKKWAKMCSEKTSHAAHAAYDAVWDAHANDNAVDLTAASVALTAAWAAWYAEVELRGQA